ASCLADCVCAIKAIDAIGAIDDIKIIETIEAIGMKDDEPKRGLPLTTLISQLCKQPTARQLYSVLNLILF
ncbi:MAG: hypothetical protein J6R91_06110, partial [Bacteroidaceae bacterium]|nr:hypothetical protein [Bacteroidaceae bacterium]